MAGPFLPVQAVNRSQKVRIGKGATAVLLQPNVTSYVDTSDGNVRRDLQRHSAIGSYIIVGNLSASTANIVVDNGGAVVPGTGVTANVSAGDLHNRSTGAWINGAAATNQALTLTTSAGQSQVFLVQWDNTTGAVGVTAGTPATTGVQVAPATPAGKTPLAQVTLANGAASVTTGNIVDVRPRP